MGKIITLLTILLASCFLSPAQTVDEKHNPKLDLNLSPSHNTAICPEHNAAINPRLNWNINPRKNGLISPDQVDGINPAKNTELNPVTNAEMNPMFVLWMSPRYVRWKGLYLFNKDDELQGYITKYSQDLMLGFDKDATWKCFYIKTAKGTYNQFNLSGKWTGYFLCFDSSVGYNLFDDKEEWTGMHIK